MRAIILTSALDKVFSAGMDLDPLPKIIQGEKIIQGVKLSARAHHECYVVILDHSER